MNSPTLAYKIELGASNYEDGPSGTITSMDRMQLLSKYESAWNQLKWGTELVLLRDISIWALHGGVLGLARGKTIVFTRLPSEIKGIPESSWKCEVDFVISEFTMDPAQDLLVILETSSSTYVEATLFVIRN